MNDQQLEQELSRLFSVADKGEDFEALAEKVWVRNKRHGLYLNCALVGAALLGCGPSYFVMGNYGFVPAVVANLDFPALANGSQLFVAAGIMFTLVASFCISSLASEQ